jgi:glucosamine--fructose-6-phosphate aminotransferase (isomerizing)
VGVRSEIGEQPQVAERLLREARPEVEALAADARRRGVAYVMIAARGTSDHAATYAQYALAAVAGFPVALATPSLFSRYATPPRLRHALVLGVSQSGRSPDVVAVVEEARRQGAATAAVTNDPTSPLAAAAEHVIALRAGTEQAVAATKTYTAELICLAALAAALADQPDDAAEALARIPEALTAGLGAEPQAERAAAERAPMTECVVLGRGFNLATGLEWALKLKELANVRAQAYSTADFQHGPVASLDPGGHILAVSAAGPLAAELKALLEGLLAQRKARVLLVSGGAAALPGADQIGFPDMLPEWLSPVAAIVPAQLFSYHLARAKGLDPEQPRGLAKVTLTR